MNKEEFIKLLDRYLSGKATEEEELMLKNYYEHYQNRAENSWDLPQNPEQLRKEMWMDIQQKGKLYIVPPQTDDLPADVKIRKLEPWKKLVAAAAVLLVLTSLVYFLYPQQEQHLTVNTSNNDLRPGTEKAILTLGDGAIINLDSSLKGTFAHQGDVEIVKQDEGKIIYNATGRSGQSVMINTMSTPRGGKYQLILPDGSRVWLNAASSITYPTAFIGQDRKVKIAGEVYFEIARNTNKPFIIDVTGKQEITVLGTSFNVNSYDDEEAVKTTLFEGSVKVSSILKNKSLILKPGMQADLRKSELTIKQNIDQEQVMAWKNGLFQFSNTGLKTVMRQLARWYDVEIEYRGAVPDFKFGGEIPMDALASQVLKVLEKNGVEFEIEGRKIIVGPG